MLPIQSETLALLKATLDHLEETKQSPFLASFEDCDYFRKHYLPAQPAKPLTVQTKSNPEPFSIKPPLPQPKQEREEKPPAIPIKTPPKLQHAEPLQSIQTPVERSAEPASFPLEEKFEELRKIWAKITSGAPLLDEIPNDELAKKMATRWKTKNRTAKISILAYQEPPAQRALLEQIAKAIDVVFGPARIVQAEPIEKEKQWEAFLSVPHLELTIACDYTLWQLGGLMHHYREIPAQGTRHLGSVPVFLLPDLSLYLKDPLLKRSLWKALCQTLS